MGSLLMTLLGRVAAKAADALVAEMLRAWGLDAARRKLERHLEAVQYILLDADARSRTNPAVCRWMADLKTAAYQADDVLENFRYEALRRRADHHIHRKGPSTARKVLSHFTANSPVLFRLSMSRKIKDALQMIDELVVEMDTFHFLQHAEAPSFDHPQTHSHVDESDVVGRQDDKEQVVKILLNRSNNNTTTDVMVLPIVGMGGIGKTTLAQLVHNDQRVKHHFELVIWICVSDKFVLQEIVQSILQVATMKKSDLTEMEALRKELSGVLSKKRYLLVLDDVWNEDRHKWDDMRSLLCSHAVSGSAILVTSRSDQVASIMGTLPPHRISALNEDQSWELFHRNAFGREAEKQEELISMAKSVVLKCKGLPLAIKTMAALLRSKHYNQWISVLDSDVWKDTTTKIVPALQLSYDHLSSEEKICFSFCAIFPKDSPMDKGMLIQLWMANDFIASETRGQEIFDVLVWRCFLQLDVEIRGDLHGDWFIHRPTTCKMHDLMHDLADYVSGNDCFILQESSSRQEILQGSTYASSLHHEVQHLSLGDVTDNTIATMEEILASRPRTVLVRGFGIPRSIAKLKFMSLRALKTPSIETHMKNLKHLRYLDCSYSYIHALPEAITMLYSLQTLKLIGCRSLEKLPESMTYMSSLRHIFLVGCFSLERMPQGIGQLNYLQTLTNYVIDSDAGRGIDQLKDLNICDALSLTGLRKVHGAEEAKQGNMSSKHNLKRLSFDWAGGPCSTIVGYEVDTNAEGILEALRPHKRLEVLKISNYTGAKLSSWIHNTILLEQLRELFLTRCNNCKDLPPLWELPSLVWLNLDELDSLTSICVGSDDTNNVESCIPSPPFFPKLETMIVSNMPKLRRWHQEVAGQVADVSFPQLKMLYIFECPMLSSMPKMIPLLEDLQVKKASDIPLDHLMNLSVQPNLECKCDISVEPGVGWLPIDDLHLLRLGDSSVRLGLKGLKDNVERFEEELNSVPCRFIKNIDIIDCNCLFSSEPSQIQRNIWNHFRFVESMWIMGRNNIVQWPAVEFRSLICLRRLDLSDCYNLTGSLSSAIFDDENAMPPRLQHLEISLCENLVEVPKLPASLEKLSIRLCRKLMSMPAFLGNIKNLRELSLIVCDALRIFPDGMYGVTSLKELEMKRCPSVETLPEGLLQQLPALEVLKILDSPKLEGALSVGGAYWDLVQAIPHRYVSSMR